MNHLNVIYNVKMIISYQLYSALGSSDNFNAQQIFVQWKICDNISNLLIPSFVNGFNQDILQPRKIDN